MFLPFSYSLYPTGNTGSLRYMAPEVALNAPYNESVDVYSMGVILWQISTGFNPYSGLSKTEFIECVIHEGQRPPLELAVLTDEMRTLLRQCWTHDWSKRPKASQVMTAIDSMLQDEMNRKSICCF